jgi:predicted transposase YbfD/YdcC
MGCQQKIAGQIIDEDADYALGLKGNQGSTLEAVEEHFSTISTEKCSFFTDVDKGHGRFETREYFASDASSVLDLKQWPGIRSVIKVISTRDIQDKTTKEQRFYISSLESKVIEKIAHSIRSHWGIENSLHYVLDVTFRQDKSRIRKDHSAENFGLVRHFAMNMLRNAPVARRGNKSLKLKRTRAGMDIGYLETILTCGGLEVQ